MEKYLIHKQERSLIAKRNLYAQKPKQWWQTTGLVTALLLLFVSNTFAQHLQGSVSELINKTKKSALIGVNIYWQGTNTATTSDTIGRFHLPRSAKSNRLIFSVIGYKSDTIIITTQSDLAVILQSENTLQEVTISSAATTIDRLSPIQTEIITSKALAKAACCNLSESFETNASVSVSYSDAVTGAKQLQFLGLSGQYMQVNTENIPTIRGLNTTFGLNFIPGTWISSIDVAKGVGSVVNGYEAMIGALNVELVKPDAPEKLYLNAYANSFGRGEVNLNLAKTINKKWSVALLTHGSTMQTELDKNGDKFLDLPKYNQVNAINRWKFQSERFMAQFGIKALYEDRTGGQISDIISSALRYQFGSTTKRIEWFSKTALLFPEKPYKGLGLIVNALSHENESNFGFKKYRGQQKSLYANLIYQGIINNTNHTYKAGLSYLLDDYHERFIDSTFTRTESIPGVFGEYTYIIPEKFTLVVGSRVDFHNLFGVRFTPRLHLKYDLNTNTALRIAAGKGWRVPNPIAENFGLLVNSRALFVLDKKILPEESWNYGLSLSHDFVLFDKKATLVLDAYRTDFQSQLIVDMESSDRIVAYNLRGKSFSNSFQAELNLTPIQRMEVKLAYRLFDVKTDLQTRSGALTLLPKMFVNRDRVLFNLGYSTKFEKWKFDFTWQWNGRRRIPDASLNHEHNVLSPAVYAPAFSNINAQVTKNFRKWAAYIGGENLGNFTQKNPIIAPNNPFGASFDASMVWGPIVGRMIYVGMRYKIKP